MRVTFLTDIPTPYVIEVIRAIATKVDLTCIFCAETATRGMRWTFREDLGFRYIVSGGLIVRRRDAEGTDYYLSPKIVWHLFRTRPEVIVSGGFSFPTFYAFLYCQLFRAKLVIFNDGTPRSELKLSWHQLWARKVLVPRAAACVAKSEPAARRFAELGGEGKTFVAPHSTKLAPLFAVAEARDWDERKELRLLSVGRLIKRKGLDHLIRALAIMRPTRRPVVLTVVGSGPEEEELRSLVKRLGLTNVSFAGFADQEQLPKYYAGADVFVFPTLGDPFGIVLLEAAASGLALVASNEAGATEDFVKDRENGLTINPEDETELSERIALLADEHPLVQKLGRAAYEAARMRTPACTAERYISAMNWTLMRR